MRAGIGAFCWPGKATYLDPATNERCPFSYKGFLGCRVGRRSRAIALQNSSRSLMR